MRELVARGQIKPDWRITLYTFGESFNHFTREPRTPASWISVGTFVEEKRGEERFETGFRPLQSEMVDLGGGGVWSFQGRISRSMFWAISIGMALVNTLSGIVLGAIGVLGQVGAVIGLILLVVLGAVSIWIGLAAHVKRWHDRDKSGWMALISLIPILGTVWVLVELGFLSGTKWANRYGDDPTG